MSAREPHTPKLNLQQKILLDMWITAGITSSSIMPNHHCRYLVEATSMS